MIYVIRYRFIFHRIFYKKKKKKFNVKTFIIKILSIRKVEKFTIYIQHLDDVDVLRCSNLTLQSISNKDLEKSLTEKRKIIEIFDIELKKERKKKEEGCQKTKKKLL